MRELTLLCILCSTLSYSQTPVSFQELGLSFDLPKGWSGQVQEDYYVAGHESISGIMVLFQNSATNATELMQLAVRGIVDEGIQLNVSDDFKLKGSNKIEGFYQGVFNGAQVKCFAIGLINNLGSGLNILVITTKDAFSDTHITEAKKLARTVNFFEGSDTKATHEWKDYIVNRQLKYMHTNTSSDYSGGSTGTSNQITIKLYTDYTFYYYSNSNASFSSQAGFGYVDSTKSNKGRYNIYSIGTDTYLELLFKDDKIYEYVLTSSEEGHTYLNGDRYFVVDIDR